MSDLPPPPPQDVLERLERAVARQHDSEIPRAARAAAEAGISADRVRAILGLGSGARSQPPPPMWSQEDPMRWMADVLEAPVLGVRGRNAHPLNAVANGLLGAGTEAPLSQLLGRLCPQAGEGEVERFVEALSNEGDHAATVGAASNDQKVRLVAHRSPDGEMRVAVMQIGAGPRAIQKLAVSEHELTNALTAITAITQRSALGLANAADALASIGEVANEAIAAAYHRRVALRGDADEEPSASDVVLGAVSLLWPIADEREVDLRHEIASDVSLSIGAADLRSIVFNLLKNAIEASPPGGEVRMRFAAKGNEADLEIRDSGRGMDPEALARAFEPFYSTKPTGLGVGLPLVRDLVDRAGGMLDVASEIDDGTFILVRLPLSKAGSPIEERSSGVRFQRPPGRSKLAGR